jgi:hypothetical protein
MGSFAGLKTFTRSFILIGPSPDKSVGLSPQAKRKQVNPINNNLRMGLFL